LSHGRRTLAGRGTRIQPWACGAQTDTRRAVATRPPAQDRGRRPTGRLGRR